MSIHAAIYELLTGDTDINTATGGAIYLALISQDAGYPAIAINTISTFPIPALVNDTDIYKARIQIDIIAEQGDYDTLKTIGDDVLSLLQRYQGTAAGTEIIDIDFDNRAEDFNENSRTFTERFDFMVTYRG